MEQNEERNARAQIEFMDKSLPLEWNAELILPDYRSEISRLLWVRPGFSAPVRFIGNGKADFSCCVHYEVLYAGPDGALYSTTEEGEYHFSVPLDGTDMDLNGAELLAELVPDAVVSRVAAPRKLTVRCRLHARVRGYAMKSLTPRLKGEHTDGVLRLCEVTTCGRVARGVGEPLELQDEVRLENEGEHRVIAARGSVFLPEAHAATGAVRCRGEAILTLLCCRETGEETEMPFTVVRRIPFEEEVAIEEATPDCHALAKGTVGAVHATVEEGKLLITAEMTPEAEVRFEDEICYDKDLFLPGMRAECRFVEERLWQDRGCGNRNFSISGETGFADAGIPAGATIVDATAEAEVREKQSEGGRTVLAGEICCRVLYKAEREYAVAEVPFPFRTVLEGEYEEVDADVDVPACRVSGERDRLRMDAELQLALRCLGDGTVRAMSEAAFVPLPAAARGDMEICYPGEGETLWEVGKRYGIAPEEIARVNGIASDAPGAATSLSGVRYLLIP